MKDDDVNDDSVGAESEAVCRSCTTCDVTCVRVGYVRCDDDT